MDKIEPCPFCGAKIGGLKEARTDGYTISQVECDNCGAAGPTSLDSQNRAYALWNMRDN